MQDIPVFIGGFRSGTTLLINLLGLHAQITPWFETRDLCEALRWQHVLAHPQQADFEAAYCAPSAPAGFTLVAVYQRMLQQVRDTHARLAGGASGKAAHERYPLGNDYVRYSLHEAEALLTSWYDACAQANGDATRVAAANGALIRALGERQQQLHGGGPWINKTPEISRFAPELRAALGRCRVMYVIRDGIQVVASGHRLGWGSVEALAFNWKGLIERTRAAMQACPGDYLELRYEQLVLEPAATLDRALAFCGREPQGAALVQQFIASQGNTAFDVSRMHGKDGLDTFQLQAFNTVAGDMQAALGYPAPLFYGIPASAGMTVEPASMYLTIKTIHMTCALISFTGFLFRAYLMVIESKWLHHKVVLVTPHVIDTFFLLSGATMAFMVNFGLFTQMWLTTKIALLMCYLLFVGIALNRGKTRNIRIGSFFLAVATFGYIVGVAVVKSPSGWLERL